MQRVNIRRACVLVTAFSIACSSSGPSTLSNETPPVSDPTPDADAATTEAGSVPEEAAVSAMSPCRIETNEKRLYCTNMKDAPILDEPRSAGASVDVLQTTFSWFDCWTVGEETAKGNTTWYHTTGDKKGAPGYVASTYLATDAAFDTGPKTGFPRCGETPSGSAPDLAKQLLALWGTRVKGNDVVKQDLTVASQGGTLNNRDTCGRTITLDRRLLAALLTLTQKYDLVVYNIVTGHGCDTFLHPKGMASDLGGVTERATGVSTNFEPGTSRDNQALDRSFVEYFATILPDDAGLGQSQCSGRNSARVRAGVHYFEDRCNHQHVQMSY